MRRSIVASKKIKSGEIIKREYLAFKRPGNGLEPSSYEKVIGKVAARDINKDDQICLNYLEDI
jgi:N,N'-diacetyllegionaminate synthase